MLLRLRISKAVGILSTIGMTTQFPLLRLPDELIALIIEHLDDLKTLRSLTRTCRRVQDIAGSELYRTVLIRSGSAARSFKRSLESRPERARAIRKLECPLQSTKRQDYERLGCIFSIATGVRDITFESPACNTADFEDFAEWDHMARHLFQPFQRAALDARSPIQEKPLQQLQNVTLHLNGANSPYWTLDARGLSIFLHPTITKLHVSCMNILDNIIQSVPDAVKGRTPLKHLILEECNVCNYGLEALLSLPKALELLYLGENCHNARYFEAPIPMKANHLFLSRPEGVMKALEQQKHSLKSLTYLTPEYYPTRPFHLSTSRSDGEFVVDGGLSEFLSLEEVTLVGYCPTFERYVMSMNSPPNLKRLALKAEKPWSDNHILEDDAKPVSIIPFLRTPSASVPKSLKHLDVTYSNLRGLSVEEFVRLRNQTPFFRDAQNTISKMGITLRIFATQNDGPQWYYPPFLYGEREPPDMLILDGENSNPSLET